MYYNSGWACCTYKQMLNIELLAEFQYDIFVYMPSQSKKVEYQKRLLTPVCSVLVGLIMSWPVKLEPVNSPGSENVLEVSRISGNVKIKGLSVKISSKGNLKLLTDFSTFRYSEESDCRVYRGLHVRVHNQCGDGCLGKGDKIEIMPGIIEKGDNISVLYEGLTLWYGKL